MEEGSEEYLYNGKEKDTTGLYYYGARYYDSQIGRFLTRDIVIISYLNPQGLNRYTYCKNNSLAYIDPDGKMEKKFSRDISKGVQGNAQFVMLLGLPYGILEDISGASRQAEITDYTPIRARFVCTIKASKGNNDVTIKGSFYTTVEAGGPSQVNGSRTKVIIYVESPEGSIELGSVDIILGDMTEGGLDYHEKITDTSIIVTFEYKSYMSENNAGVIIVFSFNLNSTITFGEDVQLTFLITSTGYSTDQESLTLYADNSLPEGTTVC